MEFSNIFQKMFCTKFQSIAPLHIWLVVGKGGLVISGSTNGVEYQRSGGGHWDHGAMKIKVEHRGSDVNGLSTKL